MRCLATPTACGSTCTRRSLSPAPRRSRAGASFSTHSAGEHPGTPAQPTVFQVPGSVGWLGAYLDDDVGSPSPVWTGMPPEERYISRAMRRPLLVLLAVAFASAVAWVSWGFYGWAAVTLTYGLWLFRRAVTLFRGGEPGSTSVSERSSLVGVTAPLDQFVAELLCQALESDGVAATYIGRANASGMMPHGGVSVSERWGRRRVGPRSRKCSYGLVPF